MNWDLLAHLNAILNFSSFCCLLAGFIAIKKTDARRHRRWMLAAASISALFLASYGLRFAMSGTHAFAGEGLARAAYLAILFSHMALAALIPPLALRLLFLAGKRRFSAHRRLARWTFPAWIYVSVTGIVVYFMLYHGPGAT